MPHQLISRKEREERLKELNVGESETNQYGSQNPLDDEVDEEAQMSEDEDGHEDNVEDDEEEDEEWSDEESDSGINPPITVRPTTLPYFTPEQIANHKLFMHDTIERTLDTNRIVQEYLQRMGHPPIPFPPQMTDPGHIYGPASLVINKFMEIETAEQQAHGDAWRSSSSLPHTGRPSPEALSILGEGWLEEYIACIDQAQDIYHTGVGMNAEEMDALVQVRLQHLHALTAEGTALAQALLSPT